MYCFRDIPDREQVWLLEKYPDRFATDILFILQQYDNFRVVELAKSIAIERLKKTMNLKEIMISLKDSEAGKRSILIELLVSQFVGELEFKTLIDLSKITRGVIFDSVVENLLKRFPELLTYDQLIDFSEKRETSSIKSMSRKILLQNFPHLLDYKDFIKFQNDKDIDVQKISESLALQETNNNLDYCWLIEIQHEAHPKSASLARRIADAIPTNQFDFYKLLEFQSENSNPKRYLSKRLLLKIPKNELNYQKLKKISESSFHWYSEIADQIIFNHFFDKLDKKKYKNLIGFINENEA